jgi:hypothetical protein
MEITLTIRSLGLTRQVTLAQDRLTIGPGEEADIRVDGTGLSPLHCSIHRQADKVWVLDESLTHESLVNGKPVPARGLPLKDGDKIHIGQHTTVLVNLPGPHGAGATGQPKVTPPQSPLPMIVALTLIVAALIATLALGPRLRKRLNRDDRSPATVGADPGKLDSTTKEQAPDGLGGTSDHANGAGEAQRKFDHIDDRDVRTDAAAPGDRSVATPKLYLRMTGEEQNEFIYRQARNISRMMSNREYVFADDVLPYIKKYVDGYARRAGNRSTAIWGEDLNTLFGRARRVAPDIIREFNARGVPKVVGLYIPMIESEYRECLTSPVGAKGLFQFMPDTARGYGVDPNDRCDVKKMAPAAAKYIKDRIAEFGSDAMSVALGIAGYNRSPDSVRRDLSEVVNSKNKERSFWTLVANSDRLDRFFQNENIKYVPKFFAAAIVGETPWAFALEMNPLSTYAGH